jgi:hypothetical protein
MTLLTSVLGADPDPILGGWNGRVKGLLSDLPD